MRKKKGTKKGTGYFFVAEMGRQIFFKKNLPSPLIAESLPPFSKKVYKVVSTIPLGQTRSYRWVAKKIGKPKAARAVGQALKANPYPLIIPCHRVVREDGSLGGYCGKKNTKLKQKILEIESYIAKK